MTSIRYLLHGKRSTLYMLLALLCCNALIRAMNFGPALDLNNIQANNGILPQIALNATSTAVAVWVEQNGKPNNIYARTFNGISWAITATNLNNEPANDASEPQIAINNNGTAFAVWQETNHGPTNIFARTFDGTNWSSQNNLNNDQAQTAIFPQIALNATGTAIAVWVEYNGINNNIFTRNFDGTSWSDTATSLNNDQTQDANNPQIALNATGTAIAVWRENNNDTGFFNIYTRTFDGTSWSDTATNLNNAPNLSAFAPQIAINNNGAAVAVWVEYNIDTNQDNIFTRTFDGTSWSATATSLNNDQARPANVPQIAINDYGTAIAVWQEVNNHTGFFNIYTRIFDGTNWSNPASLLNNNQTQNADVPQIAINDDGTAIVVWVESNNTNNNIYTRNFNGIDWTDPLPLNYNIAKITADPQVALNNLGKAIAIWDEEGSPNNIFARQTVLPYVYTQWLSSVQGTQQYIAASRFDNILNKGALDIYKYDPSNNSIDFKVTITSAVTCNRFAVYNKSDSELYIALVDKAGRGGLLQIWRFDGTSAVQIADLDPLGDSSYLDAQWWATSASQSYLATIESENPNELIIRDLVNSSNNSNPLDISGFNLLWVTKDDYLGIVAISGATATPYQIDLSASPITVTPGPELSAPGDFGFESISTCGDYIAVGLGGSKTEPAQVRLLTLDTGTNTLTFSTTVTTLEGETLVPSLARCCCCADLRPLLVGSTDSNRNYTVSVFAPDLSQLYASTLLGNNVNSVAWSCQGDNIYLTAAANEGGFYYTVKYTFSLDSNSLTDEIVLSN